MLTAAVDWVLGLAGDVYILRPIVARILDIPVVECRLEQASVVQIKKTIPAKLGKHLLCEHQGEFWFEGPYHDIAYPEHSRIDGLFDPILGMARPRERPGYFRIRMTGQAGTMRLELHARWKLPNTVEHKANSKAIPLPLYKDQAIEWFQGWMRENNLKGTVKAAGIL